ncbi:hypothetical protein DAPPUDRAFT_113101 [Daphnia pulex]|uniref:Uncharacterized protein n=1 Tax=Daphnia pulex TaxID=6669 RepID=E9HE26_DAPPU|nr:hypothetical protein DAPPUDRAFT_113101 [Daphnia pulex]|eukprot:EFX70025.1 hypothetical protein DAPPUDRAFT_113101 [Daphnia pulex]
MNPEMKHKEPPPLKPCGEEVNIPVPDRIEPQRICLDIFRNPWSRDPTGKPSRLQRPERASQLELRPRPAQGRQSSSRAPVVNKPPPFRPSPPAVMKLAEFIPPTGQDRFYHPYSPRPVRLRPRSITPPGHPESEEDDFTPQLEDCTVRSEVGDCDYQPEEEPQVEKEQEAPVRNWRIRNTKTKVVRHVASNELFRPEKAHRIIKRK